jgi:two-component system cell cycle response regulator
MLESDHLRQAVGNALRDGGVEELPPALTAAVKLLQLTREEDAGVALVSRVIETEPALAVKVMRVVNSAFYGFPRQIRSIRRAVTILGFSSVREIALHLLIYDGLVRRGGGDGFDRAGYWQHSLLVAILSRTIAQHLQLPDPDSLYAAGLLHDLGKLVLESHGRVGYSRFLQASAGSSNPVREDEKVFFGVTHDQVGAVIGESWGLPEIVCKVLALHHGPLDGTELTSRQAREVAVVAIADFIAWTQGIGSGAASSAPVLSPEMLELVDPLQWDLAGLLESADREIKEIAAFYGVKFPSARQLRANLVITSLGLNRAGAGAPPGRSGRSQSHTAPHQSLNPDEFIPATLRALRDEFGFGRLLMMQVEPVRRSLVATHAEPVLSTSEASRPRELVIGSLGGDLVRCLRERRPVLIRHDRQYAPIMDLLNAAEVAVVPVLCRGRLLGVIWLSGTAAQAAPALAHLAEVQQVAGELGVALERSMAFSRERAKAETDALTRLYNRSMVDAFLEQTFPKASASGRVFAVGLVDIDHFKRFNDEFGHQAGDDVLRIVADAMRSLTRPSDFIGRYGGEEFLFVLVNTARQGALNYAERIRRDIEHRGSILSERFPGHALTVSIGLSVYEPGLAGPEDLVAGADQALYQAKNSGRNRVVAHWQLPPARNLVAV